MYKYTHIFKLYSKFLPLDPTLGMDPGPRLIKAVMTHLCPKCVTLKHCFRYDLRSSYDKNSLMKHGPGVSCHRIKFNSLQVQVVVHDMN